jgi:CDP-glucose 4,6-dehydratase
MEDVMFDSIYKGKKVLVTGHTGVKGSWLSFWLHRMGAEVYGISHPPHTTPSHYELLNLRSRLKWDFHADISSFVNINRLSPDIVFHLAARAIVARTFLEPEYAIQSTVMGATHLLELCRTCPSVKGIVMVTSDKIYSDKNWNWGYRENDEKGGTDPYSTSKICVEYISECYRKSFGMNIAVARAGNILCGGDWTEKRLLPDIARAAAGREKVIIHTPGATRPFQFVLEALSGYLSLGQAILEGRDVNGAWNFGPEGDPLTVLDVLRIAQGVWPAVQWEVDDTPTHPGMVYLLKIDSTKARKELGWRPRWTMQEAVERAVKWYFEYYQRGNILTEQDIMDYEK